MPEKKMKKMNKKQRENKKKQDQAMSRRNRNEVRSSLRPYYSSFRSLNDKHILFVMKDTENMENILLQKIDIGQGRTLLMLPVINDDIINEYYNGVDSIESIDISKVVCDYYSIKSDKIMNVDQTNMIVFRDCQLVGINNLISVNVRPYSLNTWFKIECTTIEGVKIYKGKKLKTFFKLDDIDDYSKTYVLQDTINEILLYKALMKKINLDDLLYDIKILSGKGTLSSSIGGLYEAMATDIDETIDRFKNESDENKKLNKVIKLGINPKGI